MTLIPFRWGNAVLAKSYTALFGKLVFSLFFALAACGTFSQAKAQSVAYAPLVFYNVPNFYCCNFQWIRYPTPAEAFALPPNEQTPPCPNTGVYQLTFLYEEPTHPQGYPSDAFYQATYRVLICANGNTRTETLPSVARQWVYCSGDPNNTTTTTHRASLQTLNASLQ